jgi:hypothetical protein
MDRTSKAIALLAVANVLSIGCSGAENATSASSVASSDSAGGDDPARSNDAGGGSDGAVGSTPSCDVNNPISVISVAPISDAKNFATPVDVRNAPTPCGDGYACTFQDVEIAFNTCAGKISGFRARYVRPLDANIADKQRVPSMISIPGTGDCSVGDALPDVMNMVAAQAGVAVFAMAPRGHTSCYFAGDDLADQSDWIGPDTLGDYDRVALAFARGLLDKALKGDPARIGVMGGSNGGISSYFYGRQSHVPSITHAPLALVMPEEANPDSDSWPMPGLDPADLPALAAGSAGFDMPWGSFRLSGEPPQQDVYPGPLYNDLLRADVLADNALASWSTKNAWRSAHDDAAGTVVNTFKNQVKYTLAEQGSQDCIVPHAGAFSFFDELSNAGVKNARLLSPVDFHSCASDLSPATGYLPKFTAANRTAIATWERNINGGWIYRYLVGVAPPAPYVDPGATGASAQPDWMFMLADEANGSGTPNVYTAAHPGALVVTNSNVTLPIDGKTLAYDPNGMGTQLDLKKPAWNEAARAEVDLDFPISQDTVVVGQPDVVLFVNEATGQPFTFTVLLEDVTPASGETAAIVWPVGSERRFSHTSTAAISRQEILIDTMVHRFRAGHVMRLAISNLGLMVPTGPNGTSPMFAPSLDKYAITFHASAASGGEMAHATVPTILGSALVKAPAAWQISE